MLGALFDHPHATWRVFILGAVARIALIAYSVWHDAHFAVKYTDIDYVVFTDASRFITTGGSPYDRSTYRYTPLLAQILTPNIWLHISFGKFVFAAVDLLIGLLLVKLLLRQGLTNASALKMASVYVLNPFIINVSTRGNADAIPSLFVLLALYCFSRKQWTLAALFYGVAVHLKIYPIVYALALYLAIPSSSFFSFARVKFAVVSAGAFLGLTAFYYGLYGYVFLYETYLYHFVRSDHRHNFSVYFYQMYLGTALSDKDIWASLAFVPQVLLIVCTSLVYRRDPYFACFILTFVFVIFNKVCTVQYFVWYLALMPLVLPSSKMKLNLSALELLGGFVATMGTWLAFAYQLEFLGENTFMQVWMAGVAFFLANVAVVFAFVKNHISVPLFQERVARSGKASSR